MSTLAGAAVCLALRFEWNGQVLQAGRRPAYGVEAPNVKRQPEPPGARASVLHPLSPSRFGRLAELTASGQPLAVVLVPALPPTPGELAVHLSVVACPGVAAAPPPPGTRAAEFEVSAFLAIAEGPGAGTGRALAARGILSEAAPLDLTLRFPRDAAPEEEIQLVVSSSASPETKAVLSWSRFRHPGQERFTWREAPPERLPGGNPGSPRSTMADPGAKPGWLDYKAAWALAGEATSAAPLQRLLQRVQPFEDGLADLVDAPLRADLAALVRTRAAHRLAAVAPPRGDLPGPDYAAELRESLADLERAHRVIVRLRALGWKDPWIEDGLARHASFVVEVVAGQADRVELDQGRATALVLEARALAARVGPSLRDTGR